MSNRAARRSKGRRTAARRQTAAGVVALALPLAPIAWGMARPPPAEATASASPASPQGQLIPGGPPKTVTIDEPFDPATLTLQKAPGRRVSVLLSAATIPGDCTFSVSGPLVTGGNGGFGVFVGECERFVDPPLLFDRFRDGTLTLSVQPIDENAFGSVTLQAYDVPENLIGSIAPGDGPVSIAIEAPGHQPRVTFQGLEGQALTVRTSNNSIPGSCVVFVFTPDSQAIRVGNCGTLSHDLGELDETGTYQLTVASTGLPPGTGTIDVELAHTFMPQVIHHNISGSIINNGEAMSAIEPLEAEVLDFGFPIAFSVNEACRGQVEALVEWLSFTYGVEYSYAMFVHAREIGECGASGSTDYGTAVVTIGAGHESSANCYNDGVGSQCGWRYQEQTPDAEGRGAVCMTAGLFGTKGYACSTHLQHLRDDGTHPSHNQFVEYTDIVRFAQAASGEPVNFAGDLYLDRNEMEFLSVLKRGRSFWADFRDADPAEGETWIDGGGTGRQVDHVMSGIGHPLLKDVHLLPADGEPFPGGLDCPGTVVFCSDHRLVNSYLSFDGQ